MNGILSTKRWSGARFARRLLMTGVLILAAAAAAAAVRPARADEPPPATPTEAPTATPATPEPTAQPTTQPSVVVVVNPPAQTGGDGGGGGSQDNAAPILLVTDYHTDPSPVRSGQSFRLTVTVKNTGTKFAQSIAASLAGGGSFVGTGAPAQLGQLDPDQSATFTLDAMAARQSSGAATANVLFQYRVGEGGEQGVTRSLGLNVDGGSAVSGQPLVVVDAARVPQPPARLGESFDVSFVLRNAGTRKAYGVSASLVANDALSAAVGSGSAEVGDLAPGQAVTLTVPLVLNQASATGRATQTLALSYRDSNNTAHDRQETTSLDLGTGGRQQPKVIVAAHQTTPEHPGPGDRFTLSLTLANVGGASARQVLVRLGGEAGPDPFLSLGTSNVSFAPEIAPGGAVTLTQTLLMDGEAEGGAYSLPVSVDYENSLGEALSETETIGLLALAQPRLEVDLTKPLPDPAIAGEPFDIGVEVINVGRGRLEVSTVEVLSEDLSLTKNSLYVGPLDASISGGLTARATAGQAGTAAFRVVVHYRDELNQMQTVEQSFSLPVQAAQSAAPAAGSPGSDSADPPGGFWRVVRQLLGLGG